MKVRFKGTSCKIRAVQLLGRKSPSVTFLLALRISNHKFLYGQLGSLAMR
jgi:hypothetical protein